jgi:hypothetical protein
MLIRKGGIYRNIDEKNLQTYKDRGYEVDRPDAKDPVISDLISRAEKLKLKLPDGLTAEQVRAAVEQAEAGKAAKAALAAEAKAGATDGSAGK